MRCLPLGSAHQLAYDKLAVYDQNLQPQPMLAESWDINTDLKQFKFNLRKGVQFHNGREFTSDDVKYNIMRVRDPKLAATTSSAALLHERQRHQSTRRQQAGAAGHELRAGPGAHLRNVLQGLVGSPVDLPWPDKSPAVDAAKNATYTFDLDKAAALLKQAGVSNAETEITYSTSGYASEYASIAQIYQADLAKIGFNTTLKPVDGPTFTQQGLSQTYTGLRMGAGGGAAVVDASSLLQGGNAYNHANNFSGFKDDAYTQLVNAASTEPDTARRKQLYSQLNDYLLDQCFTFAFSLYPSIVVVGPNVHNLQFDPSAGLAYVDAWVG